jgi:hypothetical protein
MLIPSSGHFYELPVKILTSPDLAEQAQEVLEYYAEVGRWAGMSLDPLECLCARDENSPDERRYMRILLENLRVRLAVITHGLTSDLSLMVNEAIKGGKLRVSGHAGGKIGGKNRRNTSAPIQEACRAIAQALWKDNAAVSASLMAKKVRRQLEKSSSSNPPSVHTIRRYIADLSPRRR